MTRFAHPLWIGVGVVLLSVGLLIGLRDRGRGLPDRNLLLISVDTLRADFLGCYGDPERISPRIDALAREGVVFEHAYAQATATYRSHAALFTGRYPVAIPAEFPVTTTLPTAHPMLAELLGARGYATAAFTGDAMIARRFGFNRGFQWYQDQIYGEFSWSIPQALQWLEKGWNRSRPFFLFVHGYDVHPPNNDVFPREIPGDPGAPVAHEILDDRHAPNRVFDRVYYRKLPPNMEYMKAHEEELRRDPGRYGAVPLSREVRRHLLAHYAEDVRGTDWRIGRLMAGLRRIGVVRRTLVILISDHGWDFLEHGYYSNGYHGYNGIAHVPLIMAGPGIPRHRRVRAAVQLIDIPPTIFEWLRLPLPASFQGKSLLPLLRGEEGERYAITPAGERVHVRSETHELVGPLSPPQADASLAGFELYDLRKDPAEEQNLASDPAQRGSALSLVRILAAWEQEMRPHQAALQKRRERTAVETVLKKQKEFLRQFGY